MKKLFKGILILLLIVVVAFGAFLGFLTVTEYKPADKETLVLRTLNPVAASVSAEQLSVLSWNIIPFLFFPPALSPLLLILL